MKKVRNFLSVLMLTLLMSGMISNLQAQGKDHDRKRDKNKKERYSDKDRKHDWERDRRDEGKRSRYGYERRDSRNSYVSRRDHRNYHGRYTTYSHRRNYKWAPVYGHRYNTRYIYYRDYNVYYDCYNDVFVTWTGRNWVVTSRVPASIRYVDFRRTAVVGVDYWDDDLNFYIARRRPAYISISASF